ncbi:MAG: hypothetical protein J6A07_04240 [Firmicutes bacterium]|nr:hypothetical protein [Bacillota bacterium]
MTAGETIEKLTERGKQLDKVEQENEEIKRNAEFIEAKNAEKERKIGSLAYKYKALEKKYNALEYENHRIKWQADIDKSKFDTKLEAYKGVIKCAYGFSGFVSCFYIIASPIVRRHFTELIMWIYTAIKKLFSFTKTVYFCICGIITDKLGKSGTTSYIITAVIFIGIMTLILALISLLSRHIHRILKNILESYNIYDREEIMRAKNLSALAVLMNICVFVYSRIDIRINIFIVWGVLALAITAAINWQEIDRGLYVSQF